MNKVTFLDQTCVPLRNQAVSLLVTQSVGPRIIALRLADGPNLMAELPDTTLDCPGVGPFHLRGGHRLWHAPEVARRTYLPDDEPVTITPTASGLQVSQPVDAATGLEKRLHIRLPDESATVVVDHALVNHSLWPITCAPWAITQLRPGGTAILPQPTGPVDPDGLLPNRSVTLWPYSDINDPHIRWGNQAIQVSATMTEGALKLGFANPAGWLAYLWREMLFVKWARYLAGETYVDRGSSSQCYCNQSFLELETLGPISTIAPGQQITHREVWQLFAGVSLPPSDEAVAGWETALGLDRPPALLSGT